MIDPGFLLAVAEGAPPAEYVRDAAATGFNVRITDLTGYDRTQTVTRYRHVAMAAVRDLTGASFPAIGRLFGGRDHTTVMNACDRVKADPRLVRTLNALKTEVVRQWAIDYGVDVPLRDAYLRQEVTEAVPERQVVFS